MSQVAHLISEIDNSIGRGSDATRGKTLSRIVDLFLLGAPRFDDDQIGLFDSVMKKFVDLASLESRAGLARRLAPSPWTPRGVMVKIIHDDIAVAEPMLTQSPCLDDQDLMAVAFAKGQDHMLAICKRGSLSEAVTDVLVSRGESTVRTASAGNPGARFSQLSMGTLVRAARHDGDLLDLLGQRHDLSDEWMRALIGIAKEAARQRVLGSLAPLDDRADQAGSSNERSHDIGTPEPSNAQMAIAAITRLSESGMLAERHVAGFARNGETTETLIAFARLAGLPLAYVERLFDQRNNDILIVIARACEWSFETLRNLMCERDPALKNDHRWWREEEMFDAMPLSTAQQVLRFLRIRESPRT